MSEKNKSVEFDITKLEDKSLTELIDMLDELVAWFNTGDIDVEKASEKFEQGVKLADLIKQKLTETEAKVNQIKLKLEKKD